MRYVISALLALVVGTSAISVAEPVAFTAEDYVGFWEDLARAAVPRPALARTTPAPVGIVSGFGLARGTVVFGGAATNARERGASGDFDASFAIAAGFGDPRRSAGMEIVVGSTSTGNPLYGISGIAGEDGIFAEGNVGIKISRELNSPPIGQRVSIAVGASNLLSWGTPEDVDTNYFISATTLLDMKITDGSAYPVNVTFGIGSAVSRLERDTGMFMGLGVGLTEHLSASMSWLGDELMLGASVSPLDSGRLLISLAAGDVTRRVSEGRVILAIGYVWDGIY